LEIIANNLNPPATIRIFNEIQILLGDSNNFQLFSIYSNFCFGIQIFQLFGTIGEMGCGGARALFP
jgi:hypothetical protein